MRRQATLRENTYNTFGKGSEQLNNTKTKNFENGLNILKDI